MAPDNTHLILYYLELEKQCRHYEKKNKNNIPFFHEYFKPLNDDPSINPKRYFGLKICFKRMIEYEFTGIPYQIF